MGETSRLTLFCLFSIIIVRDHVSVTVTDHGFVMAQASRELSKGEHSRHKGEHYSGHEDAHCTPSNMLAPMLPIDRYAAERKELMAIQGMTFSERADRHYQKVLISNRLEDEREDDYEMLLNTKTSTESTRCIVARERRERDQRLAWEAEDTHYHVPGGYGASPAERLKALGSARFTVASAEQQREAVQIALTSAWQGAGIRKASATVRVVKKGRV
jgi:hypothetical protein